MIQTVQADEDESVGLWVC